MAKSKKEHLVETALVLFHRDGFHATGIDKILAEAKVAKMTLYKHFSSKDELILAALKLRDEYFNEWLVTRVDEIVQEKYSADDFGEVSAIFDTIGEWIRGDTFYGCMFINAAAEFGELDSPIHQVASDHKIAVKNIVRGYLEKLPIDDPDDLAKQLVLLIDGLIVTSQTTGQKDVINTAKEAALSLVNLAINQ